MLTRKMDFELISLPDCAGLRENGKCSWLNTDACIGEQCSFYRRKSSRERANRRLCSLDESVQARISKKYYGGYRPWLEDASTSDRG
ncbi:MAG: hypothetical protein GX254_04110 [Clostridiales bacterium]|jgi:hypothetical protein|nr:hypothetical protein [Clostridiales bacterium]